MLDTDPRPERILQGGFMAADEFPILVIGLETVTHDHKGREIVPHKEIAIYLGADDNPDTPKVTIPAGFAAGIAEKIIELAARARTAAKSIPS